jgi:hypothetical protein
MTKVEYGDLFERSCGRSRSLGASAGAGAGCSQLRLLTSPSGGPKNSLPFHFHCGTGLEM